MDKSRCGVVWCRVTVVAVTIQVICAVLCNATVIDCTNNGTENLIDNSFDLLTTTSTSDCVCTSYENENENESWDQSLM